MSKRYILQKPLPNVDAGTIISLNGINYECTDKYGCKAFFAVKLIEGHPDWFLPEQPEVENKDVLTWDDEKVKEYSQKLTAYYDSDHYLDKAIEDFKKNYKSKQPLKPDTKEEKIEVAINGSDLAGWTTTIRPKNPSWVIPTSKHPAIKEAIESVLNNDFVVYDNVSVIGTHKYTQQQLDEAIQKAEKDAWNFAREKMIIDGKPTERQYRFLSYYEYEIYKKSSEILYQRSLQDNSNSKTYNHVK